MASREIFEGGVPVKKLISLAVCVFFILGTDQVSDALMYKFDDTVLGVHFSASMEINAGEKMLTINLINTSPSLSSNPNLWGFGVSLLNNNAVASGLTWVLTTGGMDVSGNWQKTSLNYDTTLYSALFLGF